MYSHLNISFSSCHPSHPVSVHILPVHESGILIHPCLNCSYTHSSNRLQHGSLPFPALGHQLYPLSLYFHPNTFSRDPTFLLSQLPPNFPNTLLPSSKCTRNLHDLQVVEPFPIYLLHSFNVLLSLYLLLF